MNPSSIGNTSISRTTRRNEEPEIGRRECRTKAQEVVRNLANQMDLTSVVGVARLMSSSNTKNEWEINAMAVTIANGGQYPNFWYPEIILSGLAKDTAQRFGMDASITITSDVT